MARPISIEQARELLMAAVPVAGPRSALPLPLTDALGYVTAEDALTPADLPPFDRSLVDGFAVRASDGADLRVTGDIGMGRPAGALPVASAMTMPTGGMLPAGADAVAMKEHVTLKGSRVQLRQPVTPGQNIVRRASDAHAGDVVVPAGRRLRPSEIAMLATVGVGRVHVRARPRIAVLSTGDELVAPGTIPRPAQVPDSNGPALCAALARDGAEPAYVGIAPDDYGAVLVAIRRALAEYEALLCTGGSSVGDRDFVQQALAEVMGTPLFSGVSIRPGRPTAAFAAGAKWAVALPGHAVSALVVYELLIREAVLRFGGERDPRPRGQVVVELAQEVRAPVDRDLFERVRIEGTRAVPLRGASATIGNLARADALVRCPAGQVLPPGASVSALLLA